MMVSPKDLREIADKIKKEEGEAFVSLVIPMIEKHMLISAGKGKYEFDMQDNHSINTQNEFWLSKQHLYKPIIEELEKAGFGVSHSDDFRDGTYMIIRW